MIYFINFNLLLTENLNLRFIFVGDLSNKMYSFHERITFECKNQCPEKNTDD